MDLLSIKGLRMEHLNSPIISLINLIVVVGLLLWNLTLVKALYKERHKTNKKVIDKTKS